MKVILGTIPIPRKNFVTQNKLNRLNNEVFREELKPALSDDLTRLNYY